LVNEPKKRITIITSIILYKLILYKEGRLLVS